MRRSTIGILVAVAVGAGAAWWWTRETVSPARPASAVQSASTGKPAPPVASPTQDGPGTPISRLAGPVATPAAISAGVRDDSIYDRMVAFAQADPRFTQMARDLARERENFLFTPDDPEWARPAEQALRDYFEARAAADGPRVTSISCRSAGCEVQALGAPLCGGTPCELQAQRPPEEPVPDSVDPAEALRADWPAGLPLRRRAIFGEPIGDRFGIIVTFSREAQAPPAGR